MTKKPKVRLAIQKKSRLNQKTLIKFIKYAQTI
jgi:hypothetical protein